MAGTPYTQKTLKAMRERGRYVWKVEHWNPYARGGQGVREDCFGFMDILAIDSNEGIIAVQSTGPSGHSDHKKKILRNDYALRWVHHAKIELWSWRKLLVKRGGKLRTWQPRCEVLTLEIFEDFLKKDQAAIDVLAQHNIGSTLYGSDEDVVV